MFLLNLQYVFLKMSIFTYLISKTKKAVLVAVLEKNIYINTEMGIIYENGLIASF